MPRFSIVVLAYSVAEYLPACLESLQAQSFTDWEAVIVIDASPDNCAEIARAYSETDRRFKVIAKSINEGTHLARRSGTLAATGEWITYLDGDDEFMPNALVELSKALDEDPCDLLRFGVVVEQAGATKEACEACELYANRPFKTCTGWEALRLTFDAEGGYQQDWRAWSNVIRADIARKAFSAMTTDRLGRSQDSYEFFVMLSFVGRQASRTDIRGYRYFYGRGVSGARALSAEKFASYAHQFASVYGAMADYADQVTEHDMHSAAEGARLKLTEMLFNDWHNRVADGEKLEAARKASDALGSEAVAAELERIVRDVAYECWINHEDISNDAPLLVWHALARELMVGATPTERYRMFSAAAETHICDVAERTRRESSPGRAIINTVAPKESRRRAALSSLYNRFRR